MPEEQSIEQELEQTVKKSETIIDKTIDFLFSNNPKKWLLLIVLLGGILRFFLANNISALGDEMVHGPHIIGFLNSGLISTIAHSPLWFYLGDLVFQVLPVTMFTVRFLSFFYGIMTIIVIYLLGAKIFNKKIALLGSFFLAVSFFTIRYTLAEMDLAAIFFLITAVYLFLLAHEKNKFPYMAAICIGIASLIKTLALFFVPAFLFAFFIFKKSKQTNKDSVKKIFLFGIITGVFFLPILIHNYLWYKDKGMVDVYMAQYFVTSVRPHYAGQLGYDSGLLIDKFVSGFFAMSKTMLSYDFIIILLGLLGIYLVYKFTEKKSYWKFLITFMLSGFILLLLSNHLPTHYTTMMPFLALFAGFSLDKIATKLKGKYSYKKILTILIVIILIFQIYLLMPHLTSRSAMSKTREYAISEMDKDSIVVVDSRTYRGRTAFLFHDFHYIESSFFPNLLAINQNSSAEKVPFKLYFVECSRDDCGWGTVGNSELNQSSEELFASIRGQATLEKTFYGGGGYDEETGNPYFTIYSAIIEIDPGLIPVVDSTHEWFYYPVNYEPKEKIFDNYDVYGTLDILIYKFAWLILIASIILAIVLPIVIFIKLKS